MNDNIEKIRTLCDNFYYSGNTADEFLFTASCVDYFYYSKNIGAGDLKDGLVDGSNDGGIDYIYADDSKLYLIQGKTSTTLSYNDIRDIFYKIRETFENLYNKNFDSYSNRLTTNFISLFDAFKDEPDIEFVLFTNTILTEEIKKKVDELSSDSSFSNYTISVYGGNEIESKVLSVDNGNTCVPYGELKLDRANNVLKYDENAAIFSIKAYSLKYLYAQYSNNGLFGYNLREHISEKKVDSAIDRTINYSKDDFWYLNNGITIGCSDFEPSGNKLKLWDFSIINGAQTTYKIGNSSKINDDYDFSLVCKVVKSEESLNDEFIRNISEASNSQKPIKQRDLRANSVEQQLLQQKAKDNKKYPLAIDIKRGIKPPNIKAIANKWQRITNEVLGQLIWACDYQKPGSARSAKADIFGKDKVYNSLFSLDKVRNYNYNTLYDLVRLSNYYDEFKISYSKELERKSVLEKDENLKRDIRNKNIMLQNAKLTTLAIILFFYKVHFMHLDPNDDNIYKQNLNSDLSLNYRGDDYESKLNDLFDYIIDKLANIYETKSISRGITSQSNFLKSDTYYSDLILPEFVKDYQSKYSSSVLLATLEIFNDEKDN